MREQIKDKGRLEHILKSIERIEHFVEGVDFNDFKKDELRYFAIVKNVEIIGEASYMLSLPFKEKNSDTPWKDIIAMRHVLVHGYYQISPLQVWKVVKEDLPTLKKQIQQYYNNINQYFIFLLIENLFAKGGEQT